MKDPKKCPKCRASFVGEKIPADIADQYSGTHFMRCIGIDGGRLGVYDGIVAWMCPECHHEFPRNKHKWGMKMFEKYQALKGGK